MAKQPASFIPLPQNTGGPSSTTFDGIPMGMNLALPPQEIDDISARYMQDILLDKPGILRRRGPLTNAVEAFPDMPYPASGMAFTLDPQGNNRLAVLNGDTSHGQLSLLNSNLNGISGTYTWNGFLPTAPPTNPYTLVDAKAGLTNGLWIGTSSKYTAQGTQSLGLWRGGRNSDYNTGTITVARGSAAVVGSGTSWLANASPGMFLFASTDDGYTLTYVGVVLSVLDDTHITLGAVSPYPATAKAYKLTSIRGFEPRIVAGRVTCATSSTTVTGANTKFTTQLISGGVYNLYRASDMAWVGKVSAVTNDTSLTLTANAAIALNNLPYVILRADGNWSIDTTATPSKVGFLNAVYAERQWFANNTQDTGITTRVWFSETNDPEQVDMSPFDGNFIDVGSTSGVNAPITALSPAYNALLVFKENETFGIFGNSETTFSLQKVEDDGCLSNGSVQNYGGGVLWAGRAGIYFYDGVQTTNLVAATLGNWYKELVRVIDPTKYRMWSGMSRDHYFLFMEFANPTVPVVKGITPSNTSTICIVLNMVTKAPVVFSNFAIRGAIQMPASSGLETLFLMNTSPSTAYRQRVLANSPEVYWRLNDNTGQTQVTDSSGHGRDGDVSIINGVTYSRGAPVTFGKPGAISGDTSTSAKFLEPNAVTEDTLGGGIKVRNAYTPYVAGSAKTFMGWSYYVNVPQGGGETNPGFVMDTQSNLGLWGGIDFSPGGPSTNLGWYTRPGPYAANWVFHWPVDQWFHWAVTYNDATLATELFINGVSQGARTASFGYSGATDWRVGAFSDLYQQDIAVFPTILSAAEIQAIYNTAVTPTKVGRLFSSTHIFNDVGNDAFVADITPRPGPDFYLETKKYNAGDSMILKLWSQLLVNYQCSGDAINIDTVVGLNDVGSTATTNLPPTIYSWDTLKVIFPTWNALKAQEPTWNTLLKAVFKPRRARFLKRSQNFAFRLWQNSPNTNNVVVGPFQLGYKPMRPGRI